VRERLAAAPTPRIDAAGPWPLGAAFERCAEITRAGAKNFYYAFRLLPRAERAAMYALYAFCREADDLVDEPGPREEARARLEALRGALARAFVGAPAGPVLTALAAVRARFDLDRAHLDAVIDGCAMDLDRARYATFADLEVYLDRVASAVGRATMQVFGLDPLARADYARAGGYSVQLTNIIRDIPEDLDRGRVYLPAEDLARFGVAEEDLRRAPAGGPSGPVRDLIRFEVERARALYAEARAALPEAERRRLLPLTAISRIYERVLDAIEARGFDVWSARASIPGWRKALLGLGTLARARLGLAIPR
jgi:phytoene synthase